MLTMLTSTAAPVAGSLVANAVKDVDFSAISSEMLSLLPVALPFVFLMLAIRKGVGFLMGLIRGA